MGDYEIWGLRTELGIKDLINNTPLFLTGDTGKGGVNLNRRRGQYERFSNPTRKLLIFNEILYI